MDGTEQKILTPIKAIRAYCLGCMCGNAAEVRNCVIPDCPLYPYRMGHNPSRKGKGGNAGHFAPKSTAQPHESEQEGNGYGKDMAEDNPLEWVFERERKERS